MRIVNQVRIADQFKDGSIICVNQVSQSHNDDYAENHGGIEGSYWSTSLSSLNYRLNCPEVQDQVEAR